MNIFKFDGAVLAAASLIVCLFACSTCASRAEEAQQTAAAAPDSKPDTDLIQHGAQLYAHHCSHCHGFNMINPGTASFDLRTFPHNDKNRFVNSVTNGKNNRMPPWGDILKTDEIDSLWAFISSYKQP